MGTALAFYPQEYQFLLSVTHRFEDISLSLEEQFLFCERSVFIDQRICFYELSPVERKDIEEIRETLLIR